MRIGECLALRWRDIDLAGARLKVPGTKTAAAARIVPMAPALRDELGTHAACRRDDNRDAYVFATRTGRKYGATNIRRRVLSPAVERANERLAEQGSERLPHLTPHSLRRTYASLLVALGWDPARFMRAMGHTTAAFTLSVYAQAMDWSEGEAERLRALWEGREIGALAGTSAAEAASESLDPASAEGSQTAL
jgi:integrase